MGFTHISEDSSEIAFLLVENYNHDHSRLASAGLGIFGTKHLLVRDLFYCFSLRFGFLQADVKKNCRRKEGLDGGGAKRKRRGLAPWERC